MGLAFLVLWIYFHKRLPKWKYFFYQEVIIGLLGNFAEGIRSVLGQGIVELIKLILCYGVIWVDARHLLTRSAPVSEPYL